MSTEGGACAEVRDRSKTRGRQIQLVNDAVYKSRRTEGSTDCKETPFLLPRILLEAIMLVLLFLLSTWSEMCHSQIVYMPRYVVRPVRRSAMEALERLRLPVTRYFPQVDTQQAVPYQSGPTFMTGDVPPNQWVDDYAPAEDEEGDYINYEYRDYRPPTQYGEEVYAQDSSDIYNNLMDRYLMEQPKEDMFDVPRRRNEDHLAEPQNATTTAAPTQKVQMTAVPPAPEKKDMKSLVVPDQRAEEREDDVSGQKEEPLFRPLQSSQKTKWNNNKATQKSPIPLLKKLIQHGGQQQQKRYDDPLLDELTNLKKKKPVF